MATLTENPAWVYEPLVDRPKVEDKLQKLVQAPVITHKQVLEAVADVFATKVTELGENWKEVGGVDVDHDGDVVIVGYVQPAMWEPSYAEAFLEENYLLGEDMHFGTCIAIRHSSSEVRFYGRLSGIDTDKQFRLKRGISYKRGIVERLIGLLNFPARIEA